MCSTPSSYRQKGAYLVGRLRWLNRVSPCILPVVHDDSGVHVDAALLTEPAASRLFSYARSYMHVLSQRPASVVAFVKSMLPVKPVAEVYTSLGYSQHGKTNLFRPCTATWSTRTRASSSPGERLERSWPCSRCPRSTWCSR